MNDSTEDFFLKKLNIYLIRIYKGGGETKSNPKHTPHTWMARPLTLQRQTRLEGTGFMLHT